MVELEAERHTILMHKEETIHQKSRAIGLKAGDSNTKYFHQFANNRRLSNALWEATDEDGVVVYDTPSIQKAARRHF